MRSFKIAFLACLLTLAHASVTPPASAEELKPKFGDIDGVFYTEVSDDREACEQAIRNKIALCEQNTGFITNTEDGKYPGCLPIFREQALACADHFRAEAYKCQGSGPTRIEDFKGFSCTVTATVVDDGQETESPADTGPAMAAADYWMQARTRANVRSGPGTDYSKVGLLEAGDEVHVTGEGGDWLRIQGPDGSIAYVHRSLLVPPETTSPEPDGTAALSPKCAGMSEGSACWNELANEPGCYFFDWYHLQSDTVTWTGACAGGLADGDGTLSFTGSASVEGTGTMVSGKPNGHWVERWADGEVNEGSYVDGTPNGHWVMRWDGNIAEGPYVNGKLNGHWVVHWANGTVEEGPYVNGKLNGHWVIRYADGGVSEGPYVDGDRNGHWVVRYADGDVAEGPFVDGERNGQWVWRYSDGTVSNVTYVDGELQ